MKKLYIPLLTALCLLALCLSACGGQQVTGTDVSLADVREEMIGIMGVDDPIRISEDYLFILYGIEARDLSESAAFMITRGIFSDEIILTKAVDEEALGRVKGLLEEHLASIRDQSRDYDPASYAVAEKSKVETDGLYAWLMISEKQEELGKIFAAHRKGYAPESVPVYAPAPRPEPTATAAPTPTPAPAAETAEEAEEAGPAAAEATESFPAEPLPYGLVPEGAPAEDSWWDDVIFIGNSVGKNLQTYVTKQRMGSWPNCMGKAAFLTAGSFTYAKGAADGQIVMQGQKYTIPDAIVSTGAKKALISLGQGDIVFSQRSIEATIGDVETLLRKIRAQSPEVEIYLLGMTPRAAEFEDQYANSAKIQEFNRALCGCAEANSCYFINSFEALADEDGCLPMDCCSETYDGGIHLTDKGCQLWLDYLYRHTAP